MTTSILWVRTVLQFSFEAIDDDDLEYFPLGVRTTWRPFAADKHTRIVKDPLSDCGMTVDDFGPITWLPEEDEHTGMYMLIAKQTLIYVLLIGTPRGMYLLQSFPRLETAKFPLEAFIQGSRAELEDVTRKFCQQYNTDVGVTYAEEWENFRDNIAPQSDSVEEWACFHHVHIPFEGTIMRDEAINVAPRPDDTRYHPAQAGRPRNRPRKSIPLDYVNWSRRGDKKTSTDPSTLLPNVVVEGPPGIERYSVPVHCTTSSNSVVLPLARSRVRLPPLKDGLNSLASTTVDDTNIGERSTKPKRKKAEWEYTALREPVAGFERYWERVGQHFLDDKETFKVTTVTRGDDNSPYFEYYDTETFPTAAPSSIDQYEHSLCAEMCPDDGAFCAWVKWANDSSDVHNVDSPGVGAVTNGPIVDDDYTDSDDNIGGWVTCRSVHTIPTLCIRLAIMLAKHLPFPQVILKNLSLVIFVPWERFIAWSEKGAQMQTIYFSSFIIMLNIQMSHRQRIQTSTSMSPVQIL
jgi:hypothetical protein